MNALPTLAQLTLGMAAFICLALSKERYARHTGSRLNRQPHRTWLGGLGWSLLIGTLFMAVNASGWGLGLVSLLGILSVAALLVVVLITYRPTLLIATATGSAAMSAILLGFTLAG